VTIEELTRGLGQALQGRPEVRLALLFGSSVTRGLESARDLDVAVAFMRPVSLMDQCRLGEHLEKAAGREVDLVDLDNASTLLRSEIARHGVVLWTRDRSDLIDFRARAPLEFFDLQPYREREAEGLRRVLEASRWSSSTS
jgi:predicted nucleotidyltransferase